MSTLTMEEKEILESLKKTIPKLSEKHKYYLLGQGEGMVLMKEEMEKRQQNEKEGLRPQ